MKSILNVRQPSARAAFWLAVAFGRPFGGIRPRRFVHWLAAHAYGSADPRPDEFQWRRDRWGNSFLLHPHFLLDCQIIAFGAYDPALHRFLRSAVRPGMVCFDVGANIGAVSLHLASLAGPAGKVFCFEPAPHIFQRLKTNAEHSRYAAVLDARQLALSDANGTSVLHVARTSARNQGMGSLVNDDHPHLSSDVEVPTMTLNEFCRVEAVSRIDFIKMDVQGAEPLVLRGGRDVLTRHQPDLMIEISPYDLGLGGWTGRDLVALLEDLNYRCFPLLENGRLGPEICSDSIASNSSWENVFCIAK
ncbi:MAG TPA: FkbM family methyltransferase [Terrimicrobiaceae bacterium]